MITLLLSLQALFIALLSPLLLGFINQLKALAQNRSSPPLLQPYRGLRKLILKQPVLATDASWLFRLAPYIYFSCLLFLCGVMPCIWNVGLATHEVDVIVIVGLLAFARLSLALAAMDIGTAFGYLGARREMFVACLTEPILLLVLLNVAQLSQTTHLTRIALETARPLLQYPSLLFSFIAFVMVILSETSRIPIDNPATHLELTMIHEAMTLEYSGRFLALLEWGNAIKMMIYALLLITLFVPFGLTADLFSGSDFFISLCALGLKLILFAAGLVLLETFNSKLRLFKISEYLANAFMLAVLALLLTQLMRSL